MDEFASADISKPAQAEVPLQATAAAKRQRVQRRRPPNKFMKAMLFPLNRNKQPTWPSGLSATRRSASGVKVLKNVYEIETKMLYFLVTKKNNTGNYFSLVEMISIMLDFENFSPLRVYNQGLYIAPSKPRPKNPVRRNSVTPGFRWRQRTETFHDA
jgi:hypothetical protein